MKKKIIFEKQEKKIEDIYTTWKVSLVTKDSITESTILLNDNIERMINIYSPNRHDITIYDEDL